MAKRIVILKRADRKIKKVYSYLVEQWSEKVANEFYEKFDTAVKLISRYPEIGYPSSKKPDVKRRLITKHNCVYYRIKKDKVIIIDLLDTRRDPKTNPYN